MFSYFHQQTDDNTARQSGTLSDTRIVVTSYRSGRCARSVRRHPEPPCPDSTTILSIATTNYVYRPYRQKLSFPGFRLAVSSSWFLTSWYIAWALFLYLCEMGACSQSLAR